MTVIQSPNLTAVEALSSFGSSTDLNVSVGVLPQLEVVQAARLAVVAAELVPDFLVDLLVEDSCCSCGRYHGPG